MQSSALHRHLRFDNTSVVHLGRFLAVAFVSALLFSVGSGRLCAQARPAAQKPADLSVFGLYHRLDPDYGRYTNNGFVYGVDYTRYPHWWVKPSIEFRGKYATGPTVTESAIGGGVRLEKPIGAIYHPYADVIISAGSIKYNFTPVPILPNGKPYTTDGTITYSYGGGLDIDMWRDFAFRGDVQFEKWRLDKYSPIYLSPYGFSIGVVYRIPFKSFKQ
jgi:hypothetical protein